ncbi:MAG: ubiquitin-like domain-containing protein [Ruminococcus sp.]|nr:ubiquitin-like domain-containing protein [Ruminococcus sp.]
MKKNRCRLLALTVAALVFATVCSACSEQVKVAVHDNQNTVYAHGDTGMTVKELLEKAGVNVSVRDLVVPQGDVKWADATEDEITILRYAKVTVTDGEETKDVELNGGTVGKALDESGFDMKIHEYDGDKNALVTDGMKITIKKLRDGMVTENGKQVYYRSGELQKSTVVTDENGSSFYVGADGAVDKGYCDGVEADGVKWMVINGEATQVATDSDKTMYLALQNVAKCTDSKMSKKDKLKKCFTYLQDTYLEGSPREGYFEMDWPILYANDLFVKGKGDCYSYGAAFAYMARGIGYTETYACNSGGHGWAEVDNRVYDPEWSMHSKKSTYYGVSYDDEKVDVPYKSSIPDGVSWHRVPIKVGNEE